MRFRLIPRDEGFFDLFSESARNIDVGARLLAELLAVVAENDDQGRVELFSGAERFDEPADLLILFSPAIDRFEYFRLLKKVVAGEANISEVLATQERFDNCFSDSAAWSAYQESKKG